MRPMTTPIEKLINILRLEAEKYEDRAVLGGLARYADTWIQEAKASLGPERAGWVQEVGDRLRSYSDLPDSAARREAVGAMRRLLADIPPTAQPREASTKCTS